MTLLALDLKCGRCGTKPAIRVSAKTKAKYMQDEDDEVVGTWRCQNCGEVDEITAKAYKGAA